MSDQKVMPPSLEQVEIENSRLRDAIEKIERLAVSSTQGARAEIIGICRRVLNI